MDTITLHSEGIPGVTIVPNTFIDRFMPTANGAYVKVYLYLLRCLGSNCREISVSSIADFLDNTEKDIIRALNYWDKLNLIKVVYNKQKEITAIYLCDISQMHSSIPAAVTIEPEPLAAKIPVETPYIPPKKHEFSEEEVLQLTENDEVQSVMHCVEYYLKRPLKSTEIQLILYLYHDLKFSAELIMYLYDYCINKGKKSTAYIEAVALGWAEEGIDTQDKAMEATIAYNDHLNAVIKAFGLNRAPGQIERQYIKKWVDDYGFSVELIREACNRALLHTQKPDFKYTDKILETWHKKGAKDMQDIARLDDNFIKSNKAIGRKLTPTISSSSNKFNQFPQRTYSPKDYAELEKKLLSKGL